MKLTSKKVRDYMSYRTPDELTHCPEAIAAACNDMANEYADTDFAKEADCPEELDTTEPDNHKVTHIEKII